MYTPYKHRNLIGIMLVMMLLMPVISFAQNPINIQIVVVPPYSSAVDEYIENPDKIIVTISHTGIGMGPLDFYLQGSIISDGGISAITEPGYKPPSPLTIQEGSVYGLSPNNVGEVFDLDHIIIEGIEIDELIDTGLPEDNYQICLQAYDYYTDQPLSMESPLGCSNIFYIRNPEPPQIIMPMCGDTVRGGDLSNIIISWTTPPGAPMGTQYTLLMAEVPEGMPVIPEDIVATQLFPPFYEETTTMNMTFISPQQALLAPGNTYAFVVVAEDPSGEILFNNDGMSEVCWFTYKENFSFQIEPELPQIFEDTLVFPQILPPTLITGNMRYHFEPDENGNVAKWPLASTQVSIKPVYVLKNAEIRRSDQQGATHYDEYVMRVDGSFISEDGALNSSNHYYKDNFQTLSTTTTTPQGFFSMMFTDSLQTGLVKEDYHANLTIHYGEELNIPANNNILDDLVNPIINWGLNRVTNWTGVGFDNTLVTGGNEVQGGGQQLMSGTYTRTVTYTGDLYRYYRVVVENKYYCSSDENIIAEPGSTVDAGDLEVKAQAYNIALTVNADSTIHQQSGSPGGPLDGVKCYVARRQDAPLHLPLHEGLDLNKIKYVGIQQYDLISEGETGHDGVCSFENILRDDPAIAYDQLVLVAETPAREGSYVYNPGWMTYPDIPQYQILHPMSKPIVWGGYLNGPYGYIFSDEYQYQSFETELYLPPGNPRIAGRVMYKSASIEGAQCYTSYAPDGEDFSDIDGLFALENLEIINQSRDLTIKKYGYEDYIAEDLGALVAGDQAWFDIELVPWGNIRGTIVDEEGNAVEAYVQVDDLNMNHTERYVRYYPSYFATETFLFRAPSGERRLRIFPVSNNYLPLDTTLTIMKNNADDLPQDFGQFVVKGNKHRIKVHVTYQPEQGNGLLNLGVVEVENAKVTVNNIEHYTNSTGTADFEFASPETQFSVEVRPPSMSNLVKKTVTVYNTPSEEFTTVEVVMEMGYELSGTVTGGEDNQPVAYATVMPDIVGLNEPTAETNNVGEYILRGIPFLNNTSMTFKAIGPSGEQTWVADTKSITSGSQTLDFHLQSIDFMDISKLWKMPVEIEKLYYEGRDIFIDGAFIDLNGVNGFAPADPSQRIPFSGVQILASENLNPQGKPYAEPVENEIRCAITGFDVQVLENFEGSQKSNHRLTGTVPFSERLLTIRKNYEGEGFLLGRVFLKKSSFNLPAEVFDIVDYKNLMLCKSPALCPFVMSFMAPGGMVMSNQELIVVNTAGEDPEFTLNGFAAEAINGSAKLLPAGLKMDIKLNPVYPLTDFSEALTAENLIITKDIISNIASTGHFTIGLENWTVDCPQGWQMPQGESQIVIPGAVINTNLVSISTGYMSLSAEMMDFHDLNYDEMTLAGVVPLDVEPGAESTFYLDHNANPDGGMHYVMKLTGEPPLGIAASFTGLEGLPQGTRIKVPTMQLISNDNMILSGFEALNEPLVFFDNLELRLQQMSAKDDYLKLTGSYDLNIPGVQNSTRANLKFVNGGAGVAKLAPPTLNLSFDGKGGVKFIADRTEGDQDLNATLFSAKGDLEITDNGETKIIKGELFRHKSGGPVFVTITEPELALGSVNDPKLRIDAGEMRVVGNYWDYLWFEGPIQGAGGLTQNGNDQKTHFVVSGSINADNTEVSIDGIDTPFGDLSLAYDIGRSEFIGEITIPQYDFGAAAFGGTLNARFGKHGWYFMGGGSGKLPVLGGVNQMAILLADYDETNVFINELMEFTIRDNFNLGSSFDGIFISAAKNDLFGLSLPSFNWGVTIPVIDKKVGVSLDWDARVGVDMMARFSNPDRFTLGTRGLIHAQLTVDAGFAYAKGGGFVDIQGEGVTELSPPYVSFSQCWATGINGEIGGCLPVVGCGSVGFNKTVHAKLFIDQSGFGNLDNVKISIGGGGCNE